MTDPTPSGSSGNGMDEAILPKPPLAGLRELLLFTILAVTLILLGMHTPLGDYFHVDNIERIASDLGVWGVAFIILAGLVTPLLFLPRWPIAFACGLLYGIVAGTLLATVASVLGAVLHFLLARTLLAPMSDRLRRRYGITTLPISGRNAFLALLFLRAFPLSSFVVTNLLAGAMKVSLRLYVAASFLGMIPSTLMYAAWGKLLKKPSLTFTILAVASLLFIIIGTVLARKRFWPWMKSLRTNPGA